MHCFLLDFTVFSREREQSGVDHGIPEEARMIPKATRERREVLGEFAPTPWPGRPGLCRRPWNGFRRLRRKIGSHLREVRSCMAANSCGVGAERDGA